MSARDVTYTYDDSGFLASFTGAEGATDLSWSAGGELLGSDGPGGAVSYEYDSAGVLVSRTDDAGTVGFVNDASQSLPHAVATSDGSWWVYAGARPLAQATPDGAVRYLHADVRGDVRVVTDAAGSVTDTFSYAVDGQVTARTGATPVSVGWNGEYTDPDTGMVWLRARWYDPVSGRFISADPWHGDPGAPVSLNRYLYANADPVNNVDPSGLMAMVELSTRQAGESTVRVSQAQASAAAWRMLWRVLRDLAAISARAGNALEALRFFDSLGDPNDQDGIDGPGAVPDIEIHENDDLNPDQQPQADGAGMGLPPRCYAPWDVAGDAWDECATLRKKPGLRPCGGLAFSLEISQLISFKRVAWSSTFSKRATASWR